MSISTVPKDPVPLTFTMSAAAERVVPPTMALQGTALLAFTSIHFYTNTLHLYTSACFNFTTVITYIYVFNIQTHSLVLSTPKVESTNLKRLCKPIAKVLVALLLLGTTELQSRS